MYLPYRRIAAALLLAALSACNDNPETARQPAAEGSATASPDELRQRLGAALPAAQQFTIRPGRDTVLTGAQGTRIHIRAGSFARPAGGGPVQLTLREFYSRADMLLAGLQTRSGRRLLETGGMLYLAATAAGQPVGLRPGRSIRLQMPTRAVQSDMQLFRGAPTATGRVDWQVAPAVAVPETTQVYSESAAYEELRNREGVPPGAGDAASIRSTEPLLSAEDQYYDLEATGLGWINCDRFLEQGLELVDVRLAVAPQEVTPYLVFRDLRSIMSPDSSGPDFVVFSRVPLGARATFVALRQTGQQLQLATQDLSLAPAPQTQLRFQPVTTTELRTALNRLD